MATQQKNKTFALLNLLGYIITLVMNFLANALPINGKTTGELSDLYPNLFVPAGFTFSIWGIIYLWLGAWVVYQLVQSFRGKDNAGVSKIGIFFLLSSIANSTWIVAWHYQIVPLSLLIMFGILGSLIAIYLRLGIGRGRYTTATRALVQAPFSIYLGWITIATVANVTTLLVDTNWDGFGIDPVTWTIVMVLAATLITMAVLWTRRDYIYALVPIWAFFGIVTKRLNDLVVLDGLITTLYVAMGIIALGAIAAVIFRPKGELD